MESNKNTICVGRQAIFDRNLDIYAYELLYRGAPDASGASFTDGDMATSSTLINSFMEVGIERLTNGHKAFINLTRNFFIDMPPLPFDKDKVVLEVLEDIPVDEALISAVKNMYEQGYTVAVDDYLFESKWEPLLPYIKLIKVEITQESMIEMAEQMIKLKKLPMTLLAEKVETQEQYTALKEMGFDLFQGYFFARPNLIQQSRLEENQTVMIQLIAKLNDTDATIEEITRLVSLDPALSFKILRFINSAATSTTRTIDSIQQAIVLMGLARIRAWGTLFAMAGSNDQPKELFNLGLMRANICERLSKACNKGTADTAYTVGLLSILDGLMSTPMEEVLKQLPLPNSIKAAILNYEGEYGELLKHSDIIEQGKFDSAMASGLSIEELNTIFIESSDASFLTLDMA